MDPKIWGESGWKFLYNVSLGYPDAPTELHKYSAELFFSSLEYMLPCGICRVNYGSALKKFPLTMEVCANKTSLTQWLINIQNDDLARRGKPLMNFSTVLEKYTR